MIYTLLSLLFCFLTPYCTGLLVKAVCSLDRSGSYLLAFLYGAAVLTAFATIVSLFGSLTPFFGLAAMAMALFCVVILAKCRAIALHDWASINVMSMPFKAFTIVAILACYVGGLRTVDAFDEGLYYIQTIKWLQEFGTVKGLANLHIRLGYNSSWHVLAAGFTFFSPSYFNELGLGLMVATILFIMPKLEQSLKEQKTDELAFLLVWVLLLTNTFPKANSLSSDFPTFTILFYLSYRLFTQDPQTAVGNQYKVTRLFELLVLLAYLLTIKLSTILPSLVLLGLGLFQARKVLSAAFTYLLLVSTGALMVFVPSVVRSWYLSGYGAVPLTFTAIGLPDWAVPADQVINEKASIELAAKLYQGAYTSNASLIPFESWFPHWFEVTGFDIVLPVLLGLVAALTFVFAASHGKHLKVMVVAMAMVMVYMIVNIPDLRFIYAMPWLLIAIALTVLLKRFSERLLWRIAWGLMLIQGITFITVMIDCIKHADLGVLVTSAAPIVETRTHQLSDGNDVLIPTSGDQCWNAPLTCTPDYAFGKIKRRGTSLADGFMPAK